MREGIHPDYRPAKIQCACGNVIETRSTQGDFHIEICSQCHPFFTGKQKIMDTAGRIEKFKNRYAGGQAATSGAVSAKAEAKPAPKASKAAAPAKPPAKKPDENRAAKRAKANAGKPKPKAEAKAEAKAPEGEPAAAPAPDAPGPDGAASA